MKKLFSLVALTGMFMLMSFNTKTENVAASCFDTANEAAEIWMGCTGGSFEDSMWVFYGVYDHCQQ